MELRKKNVHCSQIGKRMIHQFFVDDDYNVPDAKNDVLRVVQGEGHVKVEGIERMENYLRVSGKLYFQVLYVTDEVEPKLSAVEGRLPFEEMVYIEEGEAQVTYSVGDYRVEFVPTLIHSRKMNLKAMVELQICREVLREEETTTGIEEEEEIFQKKRTAKVLELHTGKKDTYRIKEEITLPGTKENIGTILWTDIVNRKLDSKLIDDQLVVKGELLVFCLYLSEEQKEDWIEQTVPYEGTVECSGAEAQMYHHLYANLEDTLVDIRMDEDGEMRVLGVEATLDLKITIYQEEGLEILEDAYSLKEKCNLEKKEAAYETLLLQNHSKCKVTEQLALPELKEEILQICHSNGDIQVEHTEVTENGIQMEGILHVSFLYVKANDEVPFATWQGMVPFSYLLEAEGMNEKTQYDISNNIEQLSISMAGSGEIEVKAVLAFCSFIRQPVQTEVIDNITMEPYQTEELERRPGIVGYIVKEGEELWTLAKRYCTTIDGICAVNGLTEDQVKPGDKILIFKENMSIL